MSLEIPTWDKISGSLGSTTKEFGGDWANLISDYYNAIDIGLLDPSKRPIINTLTRYRNEKLGIFDNDQSHYVILSADDIDTGGVRKIKIRRMNSPFEEDYALLEGLPQEILNKEIDFDLNTGTNIGSDAIKNNAITTVKILDSNITLAKLASDSVNASKIVDGTITNSEISSTAAIDPVKLDRVDKDATVEKRGRWECMDKWGLDVSGVLGGMQYVGTFSTTSALDASGDSHWFATGTGGANTWAGTYLIEPVGTFQGWTRPGLLPRVRFREFLPLRASGDVAFLFGFWTGTDFPATTDGNPLTTANGGVMIGWDSDDTNIQLYVGPGDGSTSPSSPVDTTRPVPTASGIMRIIDIEFTSSTACVVKIFDGQSPYSELYNSGSITTNLPASTKSLNFLNLIRNPTNANKTLVGYSGWAKVKA
jgi:hypothetical protein